MDKKFIRRVASLFACLALVFSSFSTALAAPPTNDNFADAEAIATLPFASMVDITEATVEPDEPSYCYFVQSSVWYAYAPTETGWIRVGTAGSPIPTALHIYRATGPGMTGLQFMACLGPDSSTAHLVEAGQTYYVQAIPFYGNPGMVQVSMEQIPPPMNDNFVDAETVTSFPFSATVDVTPASFEAGEPQYCSALQASVWYSFTATEAAVIYADMAGSTAHSGVRIYRASGPAMADLQFLTCAESSAQVSFNAEIGQTYYIQAGLLSGYNGWAQINLQQLTPPSNDHFASAEVIPEVPAAVTFNTNGATSESGEPVPSCGIPSMQLNTVWFTYTALTEESLTVTSQFPYDTYGVLAIYSSSDPGGLSEIGCATSPTPLTFRLVPGATYYFQVGSVTAGGMVGTLSLELTAPPSVHFWWFPSDPSKFDLIYFHPNVFDPVYIGAETFEWDFGDGSTSNEPSPTHSFGADGDYPVTLVATTYDGRQGAFTQNIHVSTHDVAITKINAPKSATVGQIRQIVVNVRNYLSPEWVRIDLYRSVSSGFELIGSSTQYVPVRSGSRTTPFTFNYTFTSEDAQQGKVVFRVEAVLLNSRDALPTDNIAISAGTIVAR